MAGPGGVERGRISVRVLPNTSNFASSLKKYLTRIEKSLRLEIPVVLDTSGIEAHAREATAAAQRAAGRVEIPVDVDRDALRQVTATSAKVSRITAGLRTQTRGLGRALSATTGPTLAFTRSLAKVTAVAGAASAAGVGLVGLSGGVFAFAAAASQAAAAAPVLVPALASLAAVSGTLKLATSGVGDALQEAFGDAFTKLSPNATRFVASIKRLVPQLARLRLAVQDAFFDKLGDQIRPLAARYLPELQRQMTGLARVLNGTLRGALESVNNSTDQWRLATVLAGARRSLTQLSPLVERLPRLLLRIGEAATPAFDRLTGALADSLGGVFDRLTASISSGRFSRSLDVALSVVRDLGGTLINVLSTIQGIGRAASRAFGTNITTPVAAAADALARLVNSAPGQDFLTGLFASARPVLASVLDLVKLLGGAVGRLLPDVAGLAGAFLDGLKPVIPIAEQLVGTIAQTLTKIVPSLSGIAQTIGRTLGSALDAVAPVLPVVVAGLADLVDGLGGGLQSVFSALAPVLPPIAEAFRNLAGSLGEALGDALTTVGPLMPKLGEALGKVADALAQIVPSILTSIADALVTMAPALPSIADAFVVLADALAKLAPDVLSSFAAAVVTLAPILTPAATALAALAQAMTLVAPAAALLAPVAVALFNFGKALGTALGYLVFVLPGQITGALSGLPATVGSLLGAMVETAVAVMTGFPGQLAASIAGAPAGILSILNPLPRLLNVVMVAAVRSGIRGLAQLPGLAVAAVSSTPGRILVALISLPGVLLALAIRAVISFVRGLSSAPEQSASALSGVPGAIQSALAAAAVAAFSSGFDIPGAIARGIISNLGAIREAAGRAARAAADFLPGSPVKTGPLTVLNHGYAGGQIARMLADGLVGQVGAVRSAADLTAGVLAAGLDSPGVGAAVRSIGAGISPATDFTTAAAAGPVVQIDTVYTTDPEEFSRVLARKQRDVAAVYSIAALAAGG